MNRLIGVGRVGFVVLVLATASGFASAQTREAPNLEGTWSYESGSVLIRARAGDTLELFGHDSNAQWESRCLLKVAKQFRCVGTGVIFGSSEGKEKQNIPFIIRSTMTIDGETIKDEWETEPLVGKKGMSRTDVLKRMK